MQGDLAGATFTVDTAAGGSTLVVYEGDLSPAGGVSQTALVLSGIQPGLLTTNTFFSQIFLT